ncbi:hypothetical protein [Thioclava nitratireducens]|uniref:hypothetical protein n=1 Tax=Thioclava nitratireducens TaxID=1915078 RepID=UPI00247FD9D4|nr:hypothetical protein [Thioclava nitratireducens]WGT50151.1 hypothetical protein P0N61_17895 [Thioclava nitratireducens]
MAKSVNYATRDYTVEPGATLQIVRQAQFVACLAASSTFKIAFDDGSESDFEAGLTYSPESGFSRILIRNPGAQTLTVSLGIGAGNIRDGRVTINAGVTLPVREGAPDVFTAQRIQIVSQTDTLILPENPLRKEVIIQNQNSSGTLYLNGAPMGGDNKGLAVLYGGASVTLETTAAIYGYNWAMGYYNVTELSWSA